MKEIRRINKVVSPDLDLNNDDFSETEIKKILGTFDSEPGYFQQVIRPMLSPGHENELIFWLRDIGLIKNTQRCKNAGIDNCSMMSWTSTRGNDMYQWKCNGCSYKKSIREDSIFYNVRCSFKDAIRIILGWCKGKDIDSMSTMLGLKKNIVGQLYKKSADVAEKFIRANINEWKIGGPGRIVLIDTYPDVCGNHHNRTGRLILCLTEIQTYPQRYWVETLGSNRRNGSDYTSSIKTHIIKAITEIVNPGSILVVPNESRYCSYETTIALQDTYPLIISTADLERHNNGDQNLLDNLQTIWKGILDICEEAQYYSFNYVQEFLIGHMWRRRYSDTSFEMLVYQI